MRTAEAKQQKLCPWRPLYWEPVANTGERLMVALLYGFDNRFVAKRVIRDDILQGWFGKSSSGIAKLIDFSLSLYSAAANTGGSIEPLGISIGGLHAGELRATAANSETDIIRTACLLYSSMAQMDLVDEDDENDAPQQSESNKYFSTEVKEVLAGIRPDLLPFFGRRGILSHGGKPVKFGFFSPKAIVHFTVLHPVRHTASVKDARSRLWELKCASEQSGINNAVLIAATPREDDATLGSTQRDKLRENREEIEREADNANLRWYPVHTAEKGAEQTAIVAS